MTATIMPPEMLEHFKPEYVAPLVALVTHPEGIDANGRVFVLGAGYVSEIRWERSKGAIFKTDTSFTPSAVKARWGEVTNFTNPDQYVYVPLSPFYRELKRFYITARRACKTATSSRSSRRPRA